MQPQTPLTRRAVTLLQLTVAAVALVARSDGRPVADVAGRTADQNTVIEVSQGDTAVLQCPSNDEHHRFQFWWMKPDQVIGPGTPLNTDKFRYEVLTGTLYIKVIYHKCGH